MSRESELTIGVALVIAMGCGVSNAAARTDKYPRMCLSTSGSVVRRHSEGVGNPPALRAIKWRPRLPPYSRSMAG